jgi:hypothetical protein
VFLAAVREQKGRCDRDQAATIDQIARVGKSTLLHKRQNRKLESFDAPSFQHLQEKGSLRGCKPIGSGREVGTLCTKSEGHCTVLVETRQIRKDARSVPELQLALDDLCEQLSAPDESRPRDLRLLRCVGHMVSESGDSFKLLFSLPPATAGPNIRSLRELLSVKGITDRPCTEDRLHLAAALAQAVLRIHEIGWYHKGIRSSNVLFITNSSANRTIRDPILCGFETSRPEEATELSLDYLLDQVDENNLYRHPSCWNGRTLEGRYKRSYDIYALGIVLTEIGHWSPIGEAGYNKWTSRRDQLTPARFHSFLMAPSSGEKAYKSPTHDLAFRLGKNYQKATRSCFELTFDGPEGLAQFRREVVSVLDRAAITADEVDNI